MKNEIRLALLTLAAVSAPAFAQNAVPLCGPANYDKTRNAFTVMNPVAGAVNQQCLVTVYAPGAMPAQARQNPTFNLVEGRYAVELSGGGGGGGGGARGDKGGGGGGAGAAPSREVRYLAPGTYKLTIGTGGDGGRAQGGRVEAGNPTSLTNYATGQLIAGFAGADVWQQRMGTGVAGSGGVAPIGGSAGGSGGDSGPRKEEAGQAGGSSQTGGYSGVPGQSGGESGRTTRSPDGAVTQANAGGGGGAGAGSGGSGSSGGSNVVPGAGDFGGGGGGGRGGLTTADAGAAGGHGFIRLSLVEAATVKAAAPAPAPAPAPRVIVVEQAPRPAPLQRYSMSSDSLFGFGHSKLQPSGEAKLDELVGELKSVNIERIPVIGHADRIGSSELNQKVSEARAQSVKAYLVSKGIPSASISASGRGETQPVTNSDACKGPASPALIACLAPDRRVEIEVTGTRK